MNHRTICAAVACALLGTSAWAQTNPDSGRRQIVPFLEGTDVFFHVPASHIRFEGDIQPNLVVSQNFSDKLLIDETKRDRFQTAFSIVGTPRVRLRMFDTNSAPVRTPSYMPKGSASLLFFRVRPGERIGIWSPQLTVGHHSNGQDGCLFTTDDPENNCAEHGTDLANLNRHDGSFSTNFVRLGGRYRREALRRVSDDEQVGYKHLTVGVDVDLHFHTDKRVAPFYGQRRARVLLGFAGQLSKVCRSRAGGDVSVWYVGKEPADVPSWAVQVQGVCTFNDEGGWGAFVRYYGGQDYYNLGFAQSIRRLQFGVHYEQDGFLRFVSPERKRELDERNRQRQGQ